MYAFGFGLKHCIKASVSLIVSRGWRTLGSHLIFPNKTVSRRSRKLAVPIWGPQIREYRSIGFGRLSPLIMETSVLKCTIWSKRSGLSGSKYLNKMHLVPNRSLHVFWAQTMYHVGT